MSLESSEATGGRSAVTIPEHLFERAERRVSSTNFESVDEYVQFVLEEVLAEGPDDGDADAVDEDDVQARLRSLGYLDE